MATRSPSRQQQQKARLRRGKKDGGGEQGEGGRRRLSTASFEKLLRADAALAVLRDADSDAVQQASALAALKTLLASARAAETRAALQPATALLAAFAKADDAEVKWRACALLVSLLPRNDQLFASLESEVASACEVVAAPLAEPHSEDTRVHTVIAAVSFLESVVTEASLAAVRPLVAFLRSSANELQTVAASALLAIAGKSRAAKERMLAEGGVAACSGMLITLLSAEQPTPHECKAAAKCAEIIDVCCARYLAGRMAALDNGKGGHQLVAALVTGVLRHAETPEDLKLATACCCGLAALVEGSKHAASLCFKAFSAEDLATRLEALLSTPSCLPGAARLSHALCRHPRWITPLSAAAVATKLAPAALLGFGNAATALELLLDASPASCVDVLRVPDLLEAMIAAALNSGTPEGIRASVAHSVAHVVERCSMGSPTLVELGGISIFSSAVEDASSLQAVLCIVRAIVVSDRCSAVEVASNGELLHALLGLAAAGNCDALLTIHSCCASGQEALDSIQDKGSDVVSALCQAASTEKGSVATAAIALSALAELANLPDLALPMLECGVAVTATKAAEKWNELRPVADGILSRLGNHNVSVQFFLTGIVPAGVALPDGFYVVLAQEPKSFLSLEAVRSSPASIKSPTAFVFSPEADKTLETLLALASAASDVAAGNEKKLVTAIKKLVLDAMGGSGMAQGEATCGIAEIAMLKARLGSNVIQLGEVKHGSGLLRAVLFKGLAESCGLRCKLSATKGIVVNSMPIEL